MMTDSGPVQAGAKKAAMADPHQNAARPKSGPTTIIHNLLSQTDSTLDDKIVTVKTARVVDKGRFESAIKTLMKR
jgi:hypothetical protein